MGTKTNSEGEEYTTHGPWGGSDGEEWTFMPKGFIKKITITHGKIIHSIKFQTDSGTGKTEASFFGGKGGSRTDTISIDYPDEYLMSVSGSFDKYDKCGKSAVVRSLRFRTNKNSYGPYGMDPYRYGPYATAADKRFSYDGKDGVIVGFHGRFSKFLDAVVMDKSYEGNSTDEQCSKMSRKATPTPRETGPWGGSRGKPWDDGVFCTIKQVLVLVEESLNVIYGIQFVYLKRDANSILSPMHGGPCRDKMELVSVVDLDGTDEYLTGISGFYGPVEGYNGLKAITSITFHTNKRKHGPFGEESGSRCTYFTSTACPGKVVGFHGRSDGYLSAVGVHMEYF